MSPTDGDKKTDDSGLWIYRDPPGAWELEAPLPPLEVRDKGPDARPGSTP